jgi:hypothetical protein
MWKSSPPGFSAGQHLTLRLGLSERRYGLEQQLAFFDHCLAGLRPCRG